MDYPWEEVVITETPVFKSHKQILKETVDHCMVAVYECTRNEPEVCMNEFFVYMQWRNVSGEMYDEACIGPYHSHELKYLFKAFGKLFSQWEQINFVR